VSYARKPDVQISGPSKRKRQREINSFQELKGAKQESSIIILSDLLMESFNGSFNGWTNNTT